VSTAQAAPERVLSTLNADGSRRWLRPWVAPGRFLTARRWVAYALIAIFTVLPYVKLNGRPALLLDIPAREFAILGALFYPTDTLALALFMMSVFVTVFLITALFGRVWCGWGCPQTVYMEFVYRPIERLLEGKPGRRARQGAWRKPVKYALYLLVSLFLAHTFLAYFVGVERLWQWIQRSPAEHPTSFLVMAATTGLMMFDFCFFREQTCLVACPYGRFQSVMLDRDSLIVTYDEERGEPRGKLQRKRTGLPVARGDCVDCAMCVRTCPTGIDIRDGLQMECIGCAQCVDACDSVMERIGKPRGLIRYSSQAALAEGRGRIVRPRVMIYSVLLVGLVSGLSLVLASRRDADVTVLRGLGSPFVLQGDEVVSQIRIKIRNRLREGAEDSVELLDAPGGRLVTDALPMRVGAGEMETETMTIVTPRELFSLGRADVLLRVSDQDEFTTEVPHRLLGPMSGGLPPQPAENAKEASDG